MTITVSPSCINGELTANPSKSIMQRVIAISTITNGEVVIFNPDRSEDSMSALTIAEDMGCSIEYDNQCVKIQKSANLKKHIWNVGESGLSARIFSFLAGLFDEEIMITGHGTILNRSMRTLIDALSAAGLSVEHQNFRLPIIIKGKINKFRHILDAQDGSQVLTGMLIAFTQAEKDSEIEVINLKSRPYIDISLSTLQLFGADIMNINHNLFNVGGNQRLGGIEVKIEGDWSGSAFYMVGAAISGKVVFDGLNLESYQGDRAILDVLKSAGAKIIEKNEKVIVGKNRLNPFYFDATDTPDLFPPLAVLAVNCSGISRIKGISRLINKESNRFNSLKEEFKKLGLQIEAENDNMIIKPGKPTGGKVNSHNDHRIAMSLSIIGLNAEKNVIIENAECVKKSYPDFFTDYQKLGGKVI